MGSIAITGKPSGGKTLYAVREVVRLLKEDKRPIVTNLALKLDEIQRLLLDDGFADVNVYERVRLLTYEETGAFWRFRGGPNARFAGHALTVERAKEWALQVTEGGPESFRDGIVLPPAPDNKTYGAEWLNVVLEAACPIGGIIYFIDEMHEHLNARNWQKHGLVCSDYIAIHAHLGDDFYWITQAPSLVDSAFRVRTQEFLFIENRAKQVVFGKFNRAGKKQFHVASYLEPFTGTQQPQWKDDLPLDPRLANCYHRSRFGGAGDTKEKRKGAHLYWLWVCAAVFVVVVIAGVIFGPRILTGAVMKDKVEAAKSFDGRSRSSSPAAVPVETGSGGVIRRERVVGSGAGWVRTENDLYRVGSWCGLGKVERVENDCAFVGTASGLVVVVPDYSGTVFRGDALTWRLKAFGYAEIQTADGQRHGFVVSEEGSFDEGSTFRGLRILNVTREFALVQDGAARRTVWFEWPRVEAAVARGNWDTQPVENPDKNKALTSTR